MSPIPVFLISFNRGAMLERSIRGLRSMAQPTQIIVHDNGSTDATTLAILARLGETGIEVVYRDPIDTADQLNLVNDTVQAYFADHQASRYVVSDCDVDIGIADPRALDLYSELLDLFPDAQCVGPMLRIRDVPATYPLFNRLMNRHIGNHWRKRPSWIETSMGRIAYLNTPFDTTMALHRSGEPFRRFKTGVRVYEPYEALHLDWYIESSSDLYSLTSSPQISHWNNADERSRYHDAILEYSSYYAVRRGPGGLEEYEEKLSRTQE